MRSATRAGWLNAGRDLHDAVPEPDLLGALAGRRQEHLGRARVRVLLEEVVLDLPHVVDADAVGELHLVERVGEQLLLGVLRPRPRASGARRRCRISSVAEPYYRIRSTCAQ